MGGKSKRHQQAIYLDHDKAALLGKLAKHTRVPKQEYLREAVDDLLVKHKVLKVPRRKV
jgi:predicted DNA-binding protein